MSLGLDLSQAQEQGVPVPTGTYNVVIDKAELADTRSGGKMIKVQFGIIDGPQANRKIFNQYNIQNANPQATQIGLGQLKTLLTAFGHANPNRLESCEELQGLKGVIRVVVEEDPGYGPQARVKGYAKLASPGPLNGAVTPGSPIPGSGVNPF